jgi:hypothetical protein
MPATAAAGYEDPLDAFMAGEVLPEVQAKAQQEARLIAEQKLKLAREMAAGTVGWAVLEVPALWCVQGRCVELCRVRAGGLAGWLGCRQLGCSRLQCGTHSGVSHRCSRLLVWNCWVLQVPRKAVPSAGAGCSLQPAGGT